MRIISKFHDFYDPVATDFGTEPLFQREEIHNVPITFGKEIHEAIRANHLGIYAYDKYFYDPRRQTKSEFSLEDLFLIGFAGEIYPGYTFTTYDQNDRFKLNPITNYTYEIKTEGGKRLSQVIIEVLKKQSIPHPIWSFRPRRHELIISPVLKDYCFMKKLPPWDAAQKLDVYLSNLAVAEKPISPVKDEVVEAAKGFDLKWSFRKQSAKKK